MPCTTILVGKNATYDGSTFMARNEDSPSGEFTAKKFVVVNPDDQPRRYQSKLSAFSVDLPEHPLRYTAMPNADDKDGVWGEAGINELNVAMSETETITSNARVLGADPLVKDGIGEEDMLTLVLPYIHSAREGVERLGALLEQYGTYEMNGVGFQDIDEVWWFESVGGHHWIAKRVPDDSYVVMPNQQGIDFFDFKDAFGDRDDYMCSADLIEFIQSAHLDLMMYPDEQEKDLKRDTKFDARAAFGSHDDADHTYNTPRAWFMERYFNPRTYQWDGPDAEYGPECDHLPWSLIPEQKITVEDVKYVLSAHYQGTPFDPYGHGPDAWKRRYRPIGINRNNFLALTQLRPRQPQEIAGVEWVAMGSNVYNGFVPFFTNVTVTPAYFANTGKEPSTDSFYWTNRLIGALADPHFERCSIYIERYQNRLQALGHEFLTKFDREFREEKPSAVQTYLEACNRTIADRAKEETDHVLSNILYEASCAMKNAFARSDA